MSNVIAIDVHQTSFSDFLNCTNNLIGIETHCEDWVDNILGQIMELKMKHSDKDTLFKLFIEFIDHIKSFSTRLLTEDNGLSPIDAIDAVTSFVRNKVSGCKSRFKRKNIVKSNPLYVAPQSKAVGTRIEMIWDPVNSMEKPYLVQSSFQYVSIIDSLKSFFSVKENRDMYFQYQASHTCIEGIYERFCCGKLFQSSEFFQQNPTAIQLQLSTDDFEICNPLGSKSNLHKISAVYLQIRNLPCKYLSRLHNIFLVCLCNVDDLKTQTTDFNNLLDLIVGEIKYLEEVGIPVDDIGNLKGTLIYLTADNLGANLALSLAGNQSANYCRICEMPKETCQIATVEDISNYRNPEKYKQHVETVENASQKLTLRETRGVVRYCVLNDLKFYNAFTNYAVDIMHDLNEGVVPLTLKNIFNYCLNKKVLKETDLDGLVKFYSYSKIFRRDKPSNLRLDRKNLGLSSAQIRCLLLNLPFMFHKYREHMELKKIWSCNQMLIRIFQIVYSTKIDRKQLDELQKLIETFLIEVKKSFNLLYTPKMHYLLHYVTIMQIMGPIVRMSMRKNAIGSKTQGFQKNCPRN